MIIIWFIGILALLIIIAVLLNIFKNWKKLMNYKNLLTFFIIGAIPLTTLLIFTSENIWVNIISYTLLIVGSLFYGAFKKNK